MEINECKRFNEGKSKWSLVDFDSFSFLVDVLEMGMDKYGYDNWKTGRSFLETWESMVRHCFKWKDISTNDEESGLNHLGHIMANVMFLAFMTKNKSFFDDRNISEYANSARKELGANKDEWMISFILNCKIRNKKLYESIKEYEPQINNCYELNMTTFEAIDSLK